MSMLFSSVKRKVWQAATSCNISFSLNNQTTRIEKEVHNFLRHKRSLTNNPTKDTSWTPYKFADIPEHKASSLRKEQGDHYNNPQCLPKEKQALLPLNCVSLDHEKLITHKRSRRYSLTRENKSLKKTYGSYGQDVVKNRKKILDDITEKIKSNCLDEMLGFQHETCKRKSKNPQYSLCKLTGKDNVIIFNNKDSCSLHQRNILATENVVTHDCTNLQPIVDPLTALTNLCNRGSSNPVPQRDTCNQLPLNSMYFCVGKEPDIGKKKDIEDKPEVPSLEQLREIQNYLADFVPKIFSKMPNYNLMRKDIIFENNWVKEPYTTVGLEKLIAHLVRLKFKVHLGNVDVAIRIVKMTMQEEHGTIIVRWQMRCLPQMRALKIWLLMPFQGRKDISNEYHFYDGLSTLSIDNKGLVYKYSMDYVQPDENKPFVEHPLDRFIQKIARKIQPAAT